MSGYPKYSVREFSANNIDLMQWTSFPLICLVSPKLYLIGPFAAALFYWLALRSPITRYLLSTQRWMRQMLYYLVPTLYGLGVVAALFNATAAEVYALVTVWTLPSLWHWCGKDYRKHHYSSSGSIQGEG